MYIYIEDDIASFQCRDHWLIEGYILLSSWKVSTCGRKKKFGVGVPVNQNNSIIGIKAVWLAEMEDLNLKVGLDIVYIQSEMCFKWWID